MKKAVLLFLLIASTLVIRSQNETIPEEKNGEIYTQVEEQPEFPGGQKALTDYIIKNIRYPAMARENEIMGKVYIDFTIDVDGSVTNVKVAKGIGGGCDEEAVRVIKNMPYWKPGKMNGKPIKVQLRIPIQFKME